MIHAIVALLCLVSGFLSAYPVAAIFSWLSLYVTFLLFWRENEPKVIFFGLVFFWLTIPIKLFYADLYGIPYESLSRSNNIVEVTYVSLVGYMVFILGIYFPVRTYKRKLDYSAKRFIEYYDESKVTRIYVYAFIATNIIQGALFLIPGLSQLLFGFLQLKLGFIFLLIFSIQVSKRNAVIGYSILAFEIAISFFSIFSNFKDILITIIVSITFFDIFINRKRLVYFIIGVLACGYLFLVWQEVKGEYRTYLTGGEKSQEIKAERADALQYLSVLFSNAQILGNQKLIYSTVDRIGYIEFFAQATNRVPSQIPHEGGEIWKDNVLHILMPRIFFPDKRVVDDSEMVNKYCIQRVSQGKGATFSLGFMAESYIDYGWYLMYLPIFFVGYLFGSMYKLIMRVSPNYLWACVGVTPLWFNIACNGTPGTKILGWLFTYFIALVIFRRFMLAPIDKMIRKKQRSAA